MLSQLLNAIQRGQHSRAQSEVMRYLKTEFPNESEDFLQNKINQGRIDELFA